MEQSKFDELWPDHLRVLAGCPPAKKQALVEGIRGSRRRENGEVVAVVASGIHDGPFLREADVGLSMVCVQINKINILCLG
jgi:cation transport ATPase